MGKATAGVALFVTSCDVILTMVQQASTVTRLADARLISGVEGVIGPSVVIATGVLIDQIGVVVILGRVVFDTVTG